MPEALIAISPWVNSSKSLSRTNGGLERPQLGFVRSLVVSSTEIEDDGGVALRTVVERYVSTEKVAAKGLRDEDIVIEAAGGSPARPVGRPVMLRIEQGSPPVVSSNFARTLRFDAKKVSQTFAVHVLRRLYAQPRFGVTQQKTTGIINLNLGEFQKLKILGSSHSGSSEPNL